MQHTTVFAQTGVFAGWPANHGSWQWDDEFLVGFIRGKHHVGGMHNVRGRLEKVLARSLDGGETWSVEVPNVDFDAEQVSPAPRFDLQISIIRVCGDYDHGGEECWAHGGFYLSSDRGKSWQGAFSFDGIELTDKQVATSRTCVLDGLVFLSARMKNSWGTDFTYCATHDGKKFASKAIVCDDQHRAVMPAAARVGDRIAVALRRLGPWKCWIDCVVSDDGGETWSKPHHVADTGQDNGNPPALIEAGGSLFCAYGNRTGCKVLINRSDDGGYSWKQYLTLRQGVAPDIGYPRLFKRSDGKLVCVYYWTDEFAMPQRIEATIFEV